MACAEILEYVHPVGTVDFAFTDAYTWPVGTVDFELADCMPEDMPWYDIPSGKSPGIRISSIDGWNVEQKRTAGWNDSRLIEPETRSRYDEIQRRECEVMQRWAGLDELYHRNRVAFDRLLVSDQSIAQAWYALDGTDPGEIDIPWGELKVNDVETESSFATPGESDIKKRIVHDETEWSQTDRDRVAMPWGNPPWKDRHHTTLWGQKYYQEICTRDYLPPVGVVTFDIHTEINKVGDGDHLHFWFDSLTYDRRCKHREPSGWRDRYVYRPPSIIPTGLLLKVYTMYNQAFLTRLPDRLPIDAPSITLSTDWDSVYWSIKATVGRDEHLSMLEATSEGPILIETEINGHVWNLQVDSWGAGRSFAGRNRSISGRSVSAQLGAPMAELRTRTVTEQRLASQLLNTELEYTGWTAVLEGNDWLVPANTFSYVDQTPMQIIKTIADAPGAMVYTDMTEKTITVRPRYSVPPWLWDAAPAAVIIPAAMAEKVDGEWDERPFYNAAFVSGEVGGISAKIIREGSSGELVAPMVTDPLITATEVARARGIAILAASGKWSKYRISLPVFADPGVPGVLIPGTLLQFVDGTVSWKGVVAAVSVTAIWAGGGLKVRQAIEVWRYHGN